jgi:hypothetical protein
MWAEIYAGISYLVPLDPEAYMPASSSCFSNPTDLPPGTRTRDAAQSAQCGYLSCFSYPADVPPGLRRMHTGTSCFKYPGDVLPGPRRMHTGSSCFRY